MFALLVTFPKNLKKSQKSQKCVKKIVYTSRDFSQESQKSQKSQKCVKKSCLHFS